MVGRRSPKSLVRVRFLPPVSDRKAILFFCGFSTNEKHPEECFYVNPKRAHQVSRPNPPKLHPNSLRPPFEDSESEKQRIDSFRTWVVDESLWLRQESLLRDIGRLPSDRGQSVGTQPPPCHGLGTVINDSSSSRQ